MAPKDEETANIVDLARIRGNKATGADTPRHVRKQQARAEKAEKAAANRARTGRTKAQKAQDRQAAAKTIQIVDGAKRTGKPSPQGEKP